MVVRDVCGKEAPAGSVRDVCVDCGIGVYGSGLTCFVVAGGAALRVFDVDV